MTFPHLASLFIFSILTACGTTPPSHFYLLTPIEDVTTDIHINAEKIIAIGPISLPEYLNRSQIVRRNSDNELQLNEYHRWAEPLKNNFTRVLAENLSHLLGTDRVTVFPGLRSRNFDYQIIADVIRFDANAQDNIILVARWAVLGKRGKTAIIVKKSVIIEPVISANYNAMVAAKSRAVAKLSNDIAATFMKTDDK